MNGHALPLTSQLKRLSRLYTWVLGQESWGHVIAKLFEKLPNVNPGLIDKAKVLDNFYVPTRYPYGHPEEALFEHYGKIQSEEAIIIASEIIELVNFKMAR